MLRNWTFVVECPTLFGEVACVTGSCPQLGNWNPDQVVPLRLDPTQETSSSFKTANQESDGKDAWIGSPWEYYQRNVWTVTLPIPDGVEVSFRFCVCIFVQDAEDEKSSKVIVRRWETNLLPRKIPCHAICPPSPSISKFGYVSDQFNVHGGWITHETVVQLKLQGPNAVNIWKKKHTDKSLYVKVTPVNLSEANLATGNGNNDLEESLDIAESREGKYKGPIVEVAKLCESDCAMRPQTQFGIEYNNDDFILFRAQMLDIQSVAFLVDIYGRPKYGAENCGEPAEHIGSCYVMPNHFKSTEGKIQVTIVSNKLHPIGQFTTSFCVVRPMPDTQCDFSVTYCNHWKAHWKGLDVGHRGLGNSYTKRESCASVRENTIGSMKNAALHGADMVEFDVQLSQDLVPIVYHDFELLASIMNKSDGHQTMLQMPIKNFTVEQLQMMKTLHPSEKAGGPKIFQQESDDDHQPFPTLEKVLTTIDAHVGFNIELKWDMERLDGSHQSNNAFEINLFVDTVLKTVIKHAAKRKIVFSTFNPDVVYAIRLKQNRYPVLFLTQGVHSKYEDYLDPRTRTVANATYFAAMTEILGVNSIAEDLLRDPSLVRLVKEKFKLILFTWTDDRNDVSTVKQLKSFGIDGVIYDRMDWNNHKEVKESVFLVDVRSQENDSADCSCGKEQDSGISGSSSTSSAESPGRLNEASFSISSGGEDTSLVEV